MADIAGREHWDRVWGGRSRSRPTRLSFHHRRWIALWAEHAHAGDRVLEVGCGGSHWLSFFDEDLRTEIWGIDYSHPGIELARAAVRPAVAQRMIEGDFFDARLLPASYFDVVYSLGFIEHFTDGTVVARRTAELVKAGGLVITEVPNLAGIYGSLLQRRNPELLAKHVVMRPHELDELHVRSGLKIVRPAEFWGFFGPAMVHYGTGRAAQWMTTTARIAQLCVCNAGAGLKCTPESQRWSPYIVGVYRRE